MPPQKRSKKNTLAEIDQEEHHQDEDKGISHIPEPSNITDQERRAKLEALQRARARRQHTLYNNFQNNKTMKAMMMMMMMRL
jgi:hypothetical protein